MATRRVVPGRRLEPTGNYYGPVWGSLPSTYPTDQAQRVYRYFLDQMSVGSISGSLMGHGFKAVAYRYRATVEYQSEFRKLFAAPGGTAPPVDEHYRQEKSLFGFFVAGLACLESFAFSIHAIAAFYSPSRFPLSTKAQRGITPGAVAQRLQEVWPNATVTWVMRTLVKDAVFMNWSQIRNVLCHRVVPPRAITAGSRLRSDWELVKSGYLGKNQPLNRVMGRRRGWLERRIRDLWDGVEGSFPPP